MRSVRQYGRAGACLVLALGVLLGASVTAAQATTTEETSLTDQQSSFVPRTFLLEATVRDFHASHPDFEGDISGPVEGLVEDQLGPDGKPVFAGPDGAGSITSQETFNQWYNTQPIEDDINMELAYGLELHETAPGVYVFSDTEFFPIDDQLFGNEGNIHNYHFTLELHTEFLYTGGEVFSFCGDDDVWVFVNGELAADLGGVHSARGSSVCLDDLGLTPKEVYRFDLFFAERHLVGSKLTMETSIDLDPTPPLPELGTMAMIGIGLLGIASYVVVRRRRSTVSRIG